MRFSTRWATLAVVALTFLSIASVGSPQTKLASRAKEAKSASQQERVRQLAITGISWQRRHTWAWQDVMFSPHTPTSYSERRTKSFSYLRYLGKFWNQQRIRARSLAQHPPHLSDWLCIHHGEGAWNSNTGNGYYGGLQMNASFEATYGGRLVRLKGTADHWTPLEQIWVAERANRSGRGFAPWPLTARQCGLL